MSNSTRTAATRDPLADLIQHLLEFDFVITQMIERMIAFEASGRSAPDADPIPDVVRTLLRDATSDIAKRRSSFELARAGRVIGEMLDAVGENLFYVDPDFDDAEDDLEAGESGDPRVNGAN